MYVRRLTMYTPEYPSGRDIILICNDITFMIGSFGVKEDIVYKLVGDQHHPDCCFDAVTVSFSSASSSSTYILNPA